jgi:hypothetical protein
MWYKHDVPMCVYLDISMDVGRLWRSQGQGGVTQRRVWAEELRPSHYYHVDAALGYLLGLSVVQK